MDTYSVRYKTDRSMGFYACRHIDAESLSDMYRQLGKYWSIQSVTIKCHATTKSGEPCQKFHHNRKFCHLHGGE
jgi:hypothetical protein